jgi:hypothetical protein
MINRGTKVRFIRERYLRKDKEGREKALLEKKQRDQYGSTRKSEERN